jgi:hypothetical protein
MSAFVGYLTHGVVLITDPSRREYFQKYHELGVAIIELSDLDAQMGKIQAGSWVAFLRCCSSATGGVFLHIDTLYNKKYLDIQSEGNQSFPFAKCYILLLILDHRQRKIIVKK